MDEDEAEGLDVEADGGVDGLAEAGDVVERHERHRRHVLVQLLDRRRVHELGAMAAAAAVHALALFSHPARLGQFLRYCGSERAI